MFINTSSSVLGGVSPMGNGVQIGRLGNLRTGRITYISIKSVTALVISNVASIKLGSDL